MWALSVCAAALLPRQESFASLHILTRRASKGSEALPSLARRVRMSFFGARVIGTPTPLGPRVDFRAGSTPRSSRLRTTGGFGTVRSRVQIRHSREPRLTVGGVCRPCVTMTVSVVRPTRCGGGCLTTNAFNRHDGLGNLGPHGASRGQGTRTTVAGHSGSESGRHSLRGRGRPRSCLVGDDRR